MTRDAIDETADPAHLRLDVRPSSIHGRGVFAADDIAAGAVVIDYGGELIEWEEAGRRQEARAADAGHTFFFDVGDGLVIDGGSRGNVSRWINHSCEPNCAAEVIDRRVVITATRAVRAGEELLLDYQLVLDAGRSDSERAHYACACGAPSCRATMLAG